MQAFERLHVWQLAQDLLLEVYDATRGFPSHELYGLQSQLRRAAVSISANIAEGSKRETKADYAHFLNLAESSTAECQSLLHSCQGLGYLERAEAKKLFAKLSQIARMLHFLKKSVREAALHEGR